jgi:hypothetical protein
MPGTETLTITQERIQQILDVFGKRPGSGRQELSQMFSNDPAVFCAAALPCLKGGADSAAYRALTSLLVPENSLTARLCDLLILSRIGSSYLDLIWQLTGMICDPGPFRREEALSSAGQLLEIDPLFDLKLASTICRPGRAEAGQVTGKAAERTLDIVGALPETPRVIPALAHLISSDNSRLKSKATMIIGRRLQNSTWAETHLGECDPRVRANAVESLWGLDTPGARTILEQALEDPHNRVIANALVGLHKLRFPDLGPLIVKLSAHSDPLFRISGAWVMEQISDQRFLPVLTEMIRDQNPAVRTGAFRAIASLKRGKPV